MTKKEGLVKVLGARVHNLKNIDVEIPHSSLTVITGLSGSGKSSLAFDTICAEGNRRYMEAFSAYARQFIGTLEKPDVDQITGLSPVIAIEQKSTIRNPRSTVGTITEVYDYLRLLYARAATAYSHVTGEKMLKYSDDKILEIILNDYAGKAVYILAPLVDGRKGHYRELFESLRKKGYIYVRINGEIREITYNLKLDRYKTHHIELLIDKTKINKKDLINEDDKKRLRKSLDLAMNIGKGIMMLIDKENNNSRFFSRFLMCPTTGISYKEPAPHSFSFNSPQGACTKCNGLGVINDIDIDKIIPDKNISIYNGAISFIGRYKNNMGFWILEALADKMNFSLKTPVNELSEEVLDAVLYGYNQQLRLKNTPLGESSNYLVSFDGIVNKIKDKQKEDDNKVNKKSSLRFNKYIICPKCNGSRLKPEALNFKFSEKSIAELAALDIQNLYEWINNQETNLTGNQKIIASEVLKEISTRLKFLIDVGLGYLSLNRPAKSLSGGESQRIRLATQIGSRLVNVLYILDEPSIGLHQRDNNKLINSLKELRDRKNTVVVVEHDKDMILNSDHIIDLGPGAGKKGGNIVFSGNITELLKSKTLTADYINGEKIIEIPKKRRNGNGGTITISGAKGNNLKNISIDIPLGKLICVSGVSGSGKSSLINETLVPVLSRKFYNSHAVALAHDKIDGTDNVDKIIVVDQSPIGKTPRSNPSTYTGIFSDIRNLYSDLPESKIRGYKPGRFSFNVSGGRCETCKGAGLRTIEMNFLPDVYVKCEDCRGRRYNNSTLEVRFKGKSIADVLDMTINTGVDFFKNIPILYKKLLVLQEVGLGYISLGQASTTLSGGESQRVKLAAELMKKDTGKTLYVLDEPTTGLHFEDIRVLLKLINKLTDKGNTVIVIEHNMDVIKTADWVIDIGPEGGEKGGEIICTGTPEEVAKNKDSYTAKYLKEELKQTYTTDV
jgi:excinuclease ABC subunit A